MLVAADIVNIYLHTKHSSSLYANMYRIVILCTYGIYRYLARKESLTYYRKNIMESWIWCLSCQKFQIDNFYSWFTRRYVVRKNIRNNERYFVYAENCLMIWFVKNYRQNCLHLDGWYDGLIFHRRNKQNFLINMT